MDTTLDPDIVNLAKATRTIESGNDPTKKGSSGEYGYYQYEPDTWATQAKAAGVNVPLENSTPEQQNEVWYKWAKSKKDAGNNVGQIASMQNAGEGKPNAYIEGNSGTNSYGVEYDTSAYAKQVAEEYQKMKSDSNSTSTKVQPEKTFSESLPSAASNTSGFLGTNPKDNLYGKILNNSVSRGVEGVGNLLTGGGAGALGGEVGTSLATIGEKVKGLLGGQDNSKYIAPPNVNKAFLGGGASILGAGTLAGSGALPGLLKSTSVLESPAVETAMKSFDLPMSQFKTLSAGDQLEYLTQALPKAGAADKAVIQQAIEKVSPQAIQDAGGKVAFSKLYPNLAKIPGILKTLAGVGTNIGLLEAIDKLSKK